MLRRHAEREALVEVRRQAQADAIEHLRVAAADDHPVVAGQPSQESAPRAAPRHRDARREVVLVPRRRSPCRRSSGRPDRRSRSGSAFDGMPLQHACRALGEPLAHADGRRHLQAVDLVGRRIEAVAHAGGDRQVRSAAPAVLHVELVFVGRVLARDRPGQRAGCSLRGRSSRAASTCESTPRMLSHASA